MQVDHPKAVLNRFRPAFVMLTLAWMLGIVTPVHAGLLINVVGGVAGPGTSADLGVILINDGTTVADDVLIAGFSFEISEATSFVEFTGVSDLVTPYIFAGHSLFGPDITLAISPDGHTISASDNYAAPNAGAMLAHGRAAYLGRVHFTLSPLTPIGHIPLTFSSSPTTSVSAPDGSLYSVTLQTDAFINVVPEPATLTSLCIGFVGACVAFKRRTITVS